MYRRYLIILSLLFLLCMPPLAASYFYLRNSGELRSMTSMAEQQANSSEFCLVGPALHEDLYQYKLALYRAFKPDVIVLGSSRMLQYRDRFFRGRFLNMGSSLREVATGEHVLADMLAVHRPRLVLIGIDYWWFNARIEKPGRTKPPIPRDLKLDIGKLLQPYAWMRERKLSPHHFLSQLVPLAPPPAQCRIGVKASEEGSGFGPDGSYYYTGTVTGTKADVYDRRFEDTLREMHKDNSRLRHGTRANKEHVHMFRSFVQGLRAADIEVILVLPPHAPRIAREMAAMGDAYAYIDDLRMKLTAAGLAYHDLHDASRLGTSDCEFYDGSHPGDIVNARILKLLAQSGEGGLAAYLNLEAIDAAIDANNGRAMLPEPRVTALREIDFLGLGCHK